MFSLLDSANFWVVRAGKSSAHYEKFLEKSFVAVSHWDDFLSPVTRNLVFNSDGVLTEDFSESANSSIVVEGDGTTTRNFHTGQRFCNEIKDGDYVITIGKNDISFGIVTSKPYVFRSTNYEAIEGISRTIDVRAGTSGFLLRCDVDWIVTKSKAGMPSSVSKALFAPMTLFDIDSHKLSILSWVYPVFFSENQVFLSSNIRTSDDIKSYDLMRYQQLMMDIEYISGLIDQAELTGNEQELLACLNDYDKALLSLSEQCEYMSPGVYWAKIRANFKKSYIVGLVFLAISNGLSADEITLAAANIPDSLNLVIDSQMIENVSNIIREKNDYESISESLNLYIDSRSESGSEIFDAAQEEDDDEFYIESSADENSNR